MRVVFAGTPNFSADILKSLINNQQQHNIKIIASFTQPDRPRGRGKKITKSPVKEISEQHNIPVYQPENFKNLDNIEILSELKPDLMIVAAYGIILPQAILDLPKFGCINTHTSILPKYRGAAPIQAAILNGDLETGVTIMQMDKGMDTGDILDLAKCKIDNNDNSLTLLNKLIDLSIELLPKVIKKIQTNSINPIKQDNNQATYAPKIHKNDSLIDWNNNAREIHNKIRAYYPWTTAFSYTENKELIKFISSELIELKNLNNLTPVPGTIISYNKKDSLLIYCKNSIIKINKVQLPGKNPVNIADLINSKPDFFEPGTKLIAV